MKDLSWKSFGLICMALASLVFMAETASVYPHTHAASSKQAAETPPTGEALAPEDVPPPLTEEQLPAELKPETAPAPAPTSPIPVGNKTAKLQVTVIDGRTKKPIEGADVVLLETGDRAKTDASGNTPFIDAPVPREEKGKLLINRLHGQLAVISYKNGYRDSITFGVRMHEGKETHVTVWQYPLSKQRLSGNDRIEPVLYQVPYHRLFLVQLADAFRLRPDEGEGMESPDR